MPQAQASMAPIFVNISYYRTNLTIVFMEYSDKVCVINIIMRIIRNLVFMTVIVLAVVFMFCICIIQSAAWILQNIHDRSF